MKFHENVDDTIGILFLVMKMRTLGGNNFLPIYAFVFVNKNGLTSWSTG